MKKSVVIGIVVVILVLLVAGYFMFYNTKGNVYTSPSTPSSTDSSASSTSPPGPPSLPGTNSNINIEIKNFAFMPSTLTINAGDSITWTNSDSAQHTVTSDSGIELNSEMLSKGQSYSHTFNTAGTYAYHCKPHPNMKATVIVK